MGDFKGLKKEQMGAIRYSINLGKTLQEDHPEIAELYRNGNYLTKIVETLDIQTQYDVSDKVARSSVHHAITGHNGEFKIESYKGLIPNGERKRIRIKHRLEGSKIGGKIIGNKSYDEGLGIHGRTAKQKREDTHKGIIARGKIIWTNREKEYAYQLSLNSDYQRGSLVNNQLIAFELNKKYHNCNEVRSAKSVGVLLYKYKKSLENLVK